MPESKHLSRHQTPFEQCHSNGRVPLSLTSKHFGQFSVLGNEPLNKFSLHLESLKLKKGRRSRKIDDFLDFKWVNMNSMFQHHETKKSIETYIKHTLVWIEMNVMKSTS